MNLESKDTVQIEIKEKINRAFRENSVAMKYLVEAKHTYSWMIQNGYLIPEKLENDIKNYENMTKESSLKIERAIQKYDRYMHVQKIKASMVKGKRENNMELINNYR